MKTVYASLGFALGTSAALLPRDQCCFSLTASGGGSGSVGQLGDGQNRVGQNGGLATGSATYCLSNGGLTDQNGRGCILTPPTTQFQCDTGATPTTGFSVNSNGDLEYNGSTTFYACDTGDNGGKNIYTTTTSAQTGCEKITLNTGGKCAGAGNGGGASGSASKPASSAPASQPASSAPASKPASSAPASSAPSAPASSAPAPPASSAPASPVKSQPASSAPAPPASSAPAPPASSAPASPVGGGSTVTIVSTHYMTVTSCPAEVNCPATGSAPAPSVPASSAPAPPASSAPAPPASSAPAPPASSAPAPPASSAPASPVKSQPANSAPAPPASSVPAPPASSAPAASATGGNGNGNGNGACPTTLGGAYQTPHAIIPVNKDSPSKSYGTQYNATISSSESTIFNFDIPQSYSGKQCSVIFLFPKQSELETSGFTASGSGGLKFDQLTSAAPMDVTYNSCPKSAKTLDQIDSVAPGNSYVVSTGACAAGTTESIEVSSVGGYSLEFFEDWNPSPIGLFITSC